MINNWIRLKSSLLENLNDLLTKNYKSYYIILTAIFLGAIFFVQSRRSQITDEDLLRYGNAFYDSPSAVLEFEIYFETILSEFLKSCEWTETNKEYNALFVFSPYDCYTCIKYAKDMYSMTADNNSLDNVSAHIVIYDSGNSEAESLTINWKLNQSILASSVSIGGKWDTPIVALLDDQNKLLYANTIINSKERQRLLLQRYIGEISRLPKQSE